MSRPSARRKPAPKPDPISPAVRRACAEAVELALAGLPPESSSEIKNETVRWVIDHLDETEIVTQIDDWRNEARIKSGAPSTITTRAFFVGLLTTALDGQALTMTQVTKTLYRRISPEMRAELDLSELRDGVTIEDRQQIFKAAYRNVRSLLHNILAVMDPSPLPKNRVLTKTELAEAKAEMEENYAPEQLAEARRRLDCVANSLLEMTLCLVPRDVRRKWKGSVAIDATPVAAYAQGMRNKSEYASTDPDAAWYVREGNHDADAVDAALQAMPEGGDRGRLRNVKKRGIPKVLWGYEATLAIMASDDPSQPHLFPYLVLAMTMHQPGKEPGNNAMRTLRSIKNRNHPAHFLAVDRAYAPNSKPEEFQTPVDDLGYSPVFDYKAENLGLQESSGTGMILVDGAWYCPSMPALLINASRDWVCGDPNNLDENDRPIKLDIDTYRQRIETRRNYLVRLKDGSGAQDRWGCPAAGNKPLAICDRKPDSFSKADGKHRIFVISNNEEIPELCTKSAVQMPKDAGAKWLQALLYGSDEWHGVYTCLRNTVEGVNGVLKNGCHEGLADSRRRPIRGIAAATLFTAVLIWVANIRRIRHFFDNARPTESMGEPVVQRPKPKPRTGWETNRRRRVRMPQLDPPTAPPPTEMVFT